jgi:hypothetical protein
MSDGIQFIQIDFQKNIKKTPRQKTPRGKKIYYKTHLFTGVFVMPPYEYLI